MLYNVFMTYLLRMPVHYMHQPLKLDYLWAALCLVGAVYFVFLHP